MWSRPGRETCVMWWETLRSNRIKGLIIFIVSFWQPQQISCSVITIKFKFNCCCTNTMCELGNHMTRLLSKYQIDVTLVDDNARIPAQQKSRRSRSAQGAIKQERRWKSMTQIGDTTTKDPSCLSAVPTKRTTTDTFLSLPKRSSDEYEVSHKLGDRRYQMSSMKVNTLPIALRSLPYRSWIGIHHTAVLVTYYRAVDFKTVVYNGKRDADFEKWEFCEFYYYIVRNYSSVVFDSNQAIHNINRVHTLNTT